MSNFTSQKLKMKNNYIIETQKSVVKLLENYRAMATKLKDISPLTNDWADAIILAFIENGWKNPKSRKNK